jgi:hypothetical protein
MSVLGRRIRGDRTLGFGLRSRFYGLGKKPNLTTAATVAPMTVIINAHIWARWEPFKSLTSSRIKFNFDRCHIDFEGS